MALPVNYPLSVERHSCHSASIGGTPIVAATAARYRGKIIKFGGITEGAITTADCTVTVAVNGTTIGTFTITVAGAAAKQHFSGTPTTVVLSQVNTDDVISFTPAGASGASIPANFYADILAA